MNETNNAKKDVEDTIDFMLKELKKYISKPEYVYFHNNIVIKNDKKKLTKYIKFLQKDLAKGFNIPKKVLFGTQKDFEKYDKKLRKKEVKRKK